MDTPPPNKRGLMIGAFVLAGVLLLALGVFIGSRLKSDPSTSTVASSGSTTVVATSGTSSVVASATSTSTAPAKTTTTAAVPSTTTSALTKPAVPTTTTPATPTGLSQVCTSSFLHVQVRYPAGWHKSAGADIECLLFDPAPITVIPQSESPNTAVFISSRNGNVASAVAEEKSPDYVTVTSEESVSLGGRSAVCLGVTSTGAALMPAGTQTSICLVDFDGRVLAVGSNRLPGAPDLGYPAVVRDMAAALTAA